MGVPTSEVGYTSAMPRREGHEVHKDMCGHWGEKILCFKNTFGASPNHRVWMASFKKSFAPLVEVTIHGQFVKDLKMEMAGQM